MKNLYILENIGTTMAKEYYLYYCNLPHQYLLITRDSKNGYKPSTEVLHDVQDVLDVLANIIKQGNKLSIESGDDNDDFHYILDESVITAIHSKETSLDSFTYATMRDLDELIEICRKK